MCPTLTVGSFFRRKVHFFVHLFNNVKPQQLQSSTTPTSEARPKRKEKKTKQTRTEPRKHRKNPHIAPHFFGTMRLFETFWIAPKGHPFICFDILQHNGCSKIAKSPPFTFFGTVTLFKNLIWKIFLGNFFMSPKGPPSIFFSFFATSWSSQSPKGPPFQFWALGMAPTLAVLGVFIGNTVRTINQEINQSDKEWRYPEIQQA